MSKPAQKKSARRGRRNNNNNNNNNSGSSNNNRPNNNHNNGGGGGGSARRRPHRDKNSKFGGREPKVPFQKRTGPVPLVPFELFCLYYLGVTDDNRYKRPTMKDTARRIGIAPEQVELALRACGMDKHTLRDVDFDMDLAQEDIRVAPEGIDKREIARVLFDEFTEINPYFADKTSSEIEAALGIKLDAK